MMEHPEEDLLSSVLSAYQLHAGIYALPSVCGAWQMSTFGDKKASFHLIGSGQCWLHTRQGTEPVPLEGGDLVVLPHDAWHMLSGENVLHGMEMHMPMEGAGPFTELLCGYFEFAAGSRNPVLEALPDIIIVRGREAGEPLKALARLLLMEMHSDAIGTKSVLDKLADGLFVMVVRNYVAASPDQRGLLAALADTRLRKALNAIHRRPAEDWTVEALAHEAAMSRTSFAERFADIVGMTPMEYLTRWRMTQAELMLRRPGVSVAAAAEQVGYQNEAAFRRAFKRIHGFGPGKLRRWLREHIA